MSNYKVINQGLTDGYTFEPIEIGTILTHDQVHSDVAGCACMGGNCPDGVVTYEDCYERCLKPSGRLEEIDG